MIDYVKGGYYPFSPFPQIGWTGYTVCSAEQLVTWPCEVFEDTYVDQMLFGLSALVAGSFRVAMWEPDATTGQASGAPAVLFPAVDVSVFNGWSPDGDSHMGYIAFDPMFIPEGVYRLGVVSTADVALYGQSTHVDSSFGNAMANDDGKPYPDPSPATTVWRWSTDGVTSMTLTGSETWTARPGVGELGAGPRPPFIVWRIVSLIPPTPINPPPPPPPTSIGGIYAGRRGVVTGGKLR